MTLFKPVLLLSEIAKIVNSGTTKDVDLLMSYLTDEANITTVKLIDFAISQINSTEGRNQLKYYLFNGSKIQRSYAALYFKRHKHDDILLEALISKCIDEKQAFSI